MRMRTIVLASVLTGAVQAQRIFPVDGGNAAFTSPMSSVTIQAAVWDDSGQPVPGASVIFIAPGNGPTGEFTQGVGDRQTRVVTDATGVASATMYTNATAGPFLVSAWIEGTESATHIAVSNANSPAPVLDVRT